ncbi:MAG: sensor histidine kinase [Beduini sp.]
MSKKLASLDFSVNFSNNRNDEIGVLSDNLDDLSNQLSSALEDLKIANKKLKEDVEKEKQLEQQQLSFFSAVSHELKTPITILKGQLQGMIYNVGGYKDRDKYLQKSYQVTERMENLVQEILSISKMKNSTFDLSLNKTDMAQLLYSCINENNELAIQHNIEIIEQIDNSIFVNVDSSLMKKALNNIIHNAIVYSPDENVVQIKLHKIQDKIILDIENTGAHIDEHEISELFLPFTRHEKSRNRNTGGSGLGLYLVKMILDLHKMPFTMKNTKRGILFSICMERDCMK